MATSKKPSTAVAVKVASSNSVVSLKDALKAQVAALAGRTAPDSGSAIRLSPGKFTLPDGTTTPGPLELVIVDFTSKNLFYAGAYDPKNIVPPNCFSIGNDITTMVPSKNAPEPQAASCAACPNNQFGSAGDGKACKNSRLMAVLPPDADADTPMWTLATSPTANKGFDGHVSSVARLFEMPPVGVVTEVSLDPNTTYAKLMFSNPKPNPQGGVHFARMDEAKAMLAVEPDVSGFVKAKPKAAGRR
jgi:hypothetical protein